MSDQNAQQQPNNPSQTLCQEALALLPAYGLGAVDADEARLVERALQTCPDVAAELVEYQALAAALLHSAPPAQPPTALGDRILHAAAASSAATVALPKPTGVTSKPAEGVTQPPVVRRRAAPWGWLAAAAAAAALLVTNSYWVTQVQDLRTQQAALSDRLSSRNDVIERAAEGELTRVELMSVDSSSDGLPAAIVLVSSDGTVGAVYARQLPALPPEQAYQLWFLERTTGTPVSACVFQVREHGNEQLWLIDIAEPLTLAQIEAMGITIEPAGGSPQPTSDIIAAVEV